MLGSGLKTLICTHTLVAVGLVFSVYRVKSEKPPLVSFVHLMACSGSCENIQRPIMIYDAALRAVTPGNSDLWPVYQQAKHMPLTILDYCALIHLRPVCSHRYLVQCNKTAVLFLCVALVSPWNKCYHMLKLWPGVLSPYYKHLYGETICVFLSPLPIWGQYVKSLPWTGSTALSLGLLLLGPCSNPNSPSLPPSPTASA